MNVRAGNYTETGTHHHTLQWSEYLYICAFALAAVVTVDPLSLDLGGKPLIKHLPLALTLPAVALTVIGRWLSARREQTLRLQNIFVALWPLLLLMSIILAGSLYARFMLGIHNTFMNMGLYMAMVAAAAAMVTHSNDPDALLHWLMGILLAGAGVMAVLLVRYYGIRGVYHDEIFLVIPLAMWFVLGVRRRLAVWLGALAFLSMAIFSAKNTSYLTALMVCAYVAVMVILPGFKRIGGPRRGFAYYLMLVAVLAAAAVIAFFVINRNEYLPSGNVEYREHTYEAAWLHFQNSPLWGALFVTTSVNKFDLYTIAIAGGLLPTHSDVMDLLANGGLLGIGLWAYGLWRVARLAYGRLLAPRHRRHPWAPYAHTLAVISLGGVLTYTFNPVLLSPGMAYLLWSCLGLLVGLSLRAREYAEGGDSHPFAATRRY